MIWGSLVLYFAATFVCYSDGIGYYEYMGSARNVMSTANFWFTLILTVTILLIPVVAERFYFIDTRPTLTDKVRLKQKITKSKAKTGELILRRASTLRRSTRSIGRSGYAFAHQEGFGRLITSGTNMRSRGDINSNRRPNNGGAEGNSKVTLKSPRVPVVLAEVPPGAIPSTEDAKVSIEMTSAKIEHSDTIETAPKHQQQQENPAFEREKTKSSIGSEQSGATVTSATTSGTESSTSGTYTSGTTSGSSSATLPRDRASPVEHSEDVTDNAPQVTQL